MPAGQVGGFVLALARSTGLHATGLAGTDDRAFVASTDAPHGQRTPIVGGPGYGSTMANVSLAELIALLAYDNDGMARGTDANLDYGLAGALLMDLALAERIDVVGRYVVVTIPAPTGVRLMDFALRRLQRAGRAREPRDWIIRFTKDVRSAVLSQLIDAGTLRRETDRMLWVLRRTRYPTHDGSEPPVKTETRQEIRAAATRPDRLPARTAALCGLVSALGWERHVVPDLPPMQVRNRFAELRRSVWAANAVERIIDDARAASAAGAAAAGATA